MAKYSILLKDYIDLINEDNKSGKTSINDKIEFARSYIFNFNYTLWDDTYKPVLETKILKHFYMSEIGFETTELWQLKLEILINEITPEINELYKSTNLDFNILENYRISENAKRSNDSKQTGNTQNNSNANNNQLSRFSDTPQGNIDFNSDLSGYATSLTKNQDESTSNDVSSTNQTINTDEDYERVVFGNTGGSYASLIRDFREVILNIDLIVIDRLKQLFMLIY